MGLARVIATGAGVVIGGVAIFAGTGSFEDNTTRNDAGEITDSGGLGAMMLRVGDCFNGASSGFVASVEAIPCVEPHDLQVYATFDVDDLDEYDAHAVELAYIEGCADRWQDAIGSIYLDQAELDIYGMQPTEEGWAAGDHEVVCAVGTVDGSKSRGSRLVD